MKFKDRRIFENLFRWVFIVGTVFIIPFIYSEATPDPVLSKRFLTLSFFLLLLSVLICFRLKNIKHELVIFKRYIFLALFAYLFLGIISLMKAVNIIEGIDEILLILMSIILLFYTTIIFNNKDSLLSFTRSLVIGVIILSLVGFAQYYFNLKAIPGGFGWPYGSMANGNLYSSALFLTTPFVFFGVFSFTGAWRAASNVAFTFSLINMIITQTRAVWFALIMATAFIIVLALSIYGKTLFVRLRKKGLVSRIIKHLATLSLTIGCGVISITIYNPEEPIQDTMLSMVDLENASVNERLILWEKSIEMFKDYPITGVGLGNWKIRFPEYGTEGLRAETGYTNYQRPHNDYLWVLTETGIFGFLAFIMIFIISFYYGIKTVRKSSRFEDKLLAMCFIFGLVGYILLSFFSYPKERIFHTLYLILILGGILSLYTRTFPCKSNLGYKHSLVFIVPVMIMITYSLWFGLQKYFSEKFVRNALIARQEGRWNEVIKELEMANTRILSLDHTATPLAWYHGVANFSQNKVNEAFRDFELAYRQNPNHVHVLNNLATVHELKGNHETAIKFYSQAIAISPKFEDAIINLAAVYFNKGAYRQAYDTIRQVDPNSSNPKFLQYFLAIQEKLEDYD